MKLYFRCLNEKAEFASEDYSLEEGHRVVEDERGDKKLMGIVEAAIVGVVTSNLKNTIQLS